MNWYSPNLAIILTAIMTVIGYCFGYYAGRGKAKRKEKREMSDIPTDGSYIDNVEEEGDAPYILKQPCKHFKNTFYRGNTHCDKCLIEKLEKQLESANNLNEELNKKYGFIDSIPNKCSKCGLRFTDSMGNPVVMGYVCGNTDCPCGLGGTTC